MRKAQLSSQRRGGVAGMRERRRSRARSRAIAEARAGNAGGRHVWLAADPATPSLSLLYYLSLSLSFYYYLSLSLSLSLKPKLVPKGCRERAPHERPLCGRCPFGCVGFKAKHMLLAAYLPRAKFRAGRTGCLLLFLLCTVV